MPHDHFEGAYEGYRGYGPVPSWHEPEGADGPIFTWWVLVPVGGKPGKAFWASEDAAVDAAIAEGEEGQQSLFFWAHGDMGGGTWEEYRFPFVEPPAAFVNPWDMAPERITGGEEPLPWPHSGDGRMTLGQVLGYV